MTMIIEEGLRNGVVAGSEFYLVLDSIGANAPTSGFFKLLWEERV